MPRTNPKCIQCDKTESLLWRNSEAGVICHDCHQLNENNAIIDLERESENSNANANSGNKMNNTGTTRKSTRTTRFKAKAAATAAATATTTKTIGTGRGRREIFKRSVPIKSPFVPAETRTVESVFHNGSYVQIGDIVSLMDEDDNLYYAQIRGLLIDTFCEKSAFLTWLIPTQSSPPPNDRFDPSTYLIGPDEDSPRKLSFMEFIMHAPSNYYHDKTTPFPPPDILDYSSPNNGFIWTRLNEQATSRRDQPSTSRQEDEPIIIDE